MWQALIALGLSLAQSVGGKAGAIATQIFNTAETLIGASDEVKATLVPWIQYANKIVDDKRDPTPEEDAAINAFADAVREQNRLLHAGTPFDQLPPLPSPPSG